MRSNNDRNIMNRFLDFTKLGLDDIDKMLEKFSPISDLAR